MLNISDLLAKIMCLLSDKSEQSSSHISQFSVSNEDLTNTSSINSVLNKPELFLFHAGYLSIDLDKIRLSYQETGKLDKLYLKIPNLEISTNILKHLETIPELSEYSFKNISQVKKCFVDSLLSALFEQNLKQAKQYLQSFFTCYFSYDSIQTENTMRDCLYLLIDFVLQRSNLSSEFFINKEVQNINGRADLIITKVKQKKQVVIELKFNKDPQKTEYVLKKAKEQVIQRAYGIKPDYDLLQYVFILEKKDKSVNCILEKVKTK